MKAKFKEVFNENRKPLYKLIPLDTPMAVGFGVSQACNIRCKYCIHSLSADELSQKGFAQKNMDWSTFTKAADMLKEFPSRIKSISVSGLGESLCNPRFVDMIKYLKQADVADDVSFITNGLLLNKDKIKEIIDAGLDRIFISLQGMRGDKYEEVCGKNIDFDEYVDNLRFLYEYSCNKCKINIKIADIALEDGDKEKFFETFGNICDKIHIETIKPMYSDVDYSDILESNLSDMTVSRFGRAHKKQSACYLSFYQLVINPDGEIKPCGTPFSERLGFGNINHTSLTKAWNGEIRRQFLIDMLEGRRFANPICKDCDFPNDVPTENDEIDPHKDEILKKMSKL